MAKGLLPRFMDYVDSRAEEACWNWTGYTKKGYGSFKFFGVNKPAHRVSYELFNGPVPNDMMVCHKCDNPACVNPKHLFLGTAQDNMSDKIRKGRHKGAKSGEENHKAKLTGWQVDEIRAMLNDGFRQREIACKYDISQTIVSNIKTGKRWKS